VTDDNAFRLGPHEISAGWRRLADEIGQDNGADAVDIKRVAADVEGVRRAIFDDGQTVGQCGEELDEVIPGTNGLLYRGAAHMSFAPRESAKTFVLLTILIAAANAGARVLYLDLENGESTMRERIEAILDANPDWSDPVDAGALVCVSWPTLSRAWKPETWAAALAEYSIVCVDPLHRMLEAHGLEEKDGFGALVGSRIPPLRARGGTVVMADNVGHESRDRPRGDSRKEDDTPQVYKCVPVEPFDQVRVGRVRLVCKRSRFGDTNRAWEARMGGGIFELPETRTESPKVRAAKHMAEREQNFRRVVVAVLQEEAPLGLKRLLEAVRERDVKVRTAKAKEWLSKLVGDAASGVVHDEAHGYELGGFPKGVPEGDSRPPIEERIGGVGQTPPPTAESDPVEEARSAPDSGRVADCLRVLKAGGDPSGLYTAGRSDSLGPTSPTTRRTTPA